MGMSVGGSFLDVDDFFRKGMEEAMSKQNEIGQEAVAYAKENGSYKDQTGTLRRSNEYHVTEEGVELVNTAPYASNVESKGYNVVSNAALFLEKRLKEEFK